VSIISRGFSGRRRSDDGRLPPGQYLERGFPILQATPTPAVDTRKWQFTITTEDGTTARRWDWDEFTALPAERLTKDIHCVTKWTKLDSAWRGISLDTLLDGVEIAPDEQYAMAHCDGGYTTNVPLEDLVDGRAWVVDTYDGEPLAPEHGGPARLLVPHLYFWKSAKWLRRLSLLEQDEPGFWETFGYHNYGDPWREQRYSDD